MTELSLVNDDGLYLESRRGIVKTVKEWKAECDQFYKDLGGERRITNTWERFQRVIGLHRVGVKEWDYRKPARAREGLTVTTGYDND